MMRMPSRQRGLTLVEMLVAVALSVLVALAAVSALVVSRRGFTTVDAASELRDNARFAAGMVQRITAQAGFLDNEFASKTRDREAQGVLLPANAVEPNVQGFNNALIEDDDDPVGTAANGSRTGACNTDDGGGCSDILVVRYQPQALVRAQGAASMPSDNSIIDCRGSPLPEGPLSRDERSVSVFYVALHRGEPTLMCITGLQIVTADGDSRIAPYGANSVDRTVASDTWQEPVPVVQGVESFQVLYGTDGVNPGAAPGASDSVPDRYLRADQLVADGDPFGANTYRNWRRVRSVRIGMVLRGPTGSLPEGDDRDLFPFGPAATASGAAGSAMSAGANDAGTTYTPLNDRRLRHTVTFTVYLHNDQGLCVGQTCALE